MVSEKGESTHFFSSVAFGQTVFLLAHTDTDFNKSVKVEGVAMHRRLTQLPKERLVWVI